MKISFAPMEIPLSAKSERAIASLRKIIALVGAVTFESLGITHLFHAAVQAIDDDRRQRSCHVADTEPDQFLAGFFSWYTATLLAISENR